MRQCRRVHPGRGLRRALTLSVKRPDDVCGQASDLGIQFAARPPMRYSSYVRSSDDVVSEAELHALSGPELLDRTRDLVTAMNRIAAELARTGRVADSKQAFAGDGQKTAQSWLRGHCRLSRAAASQVVRNGRALEQLPAVEEGHASGALTADQADVIAKITGPRFAALIE